MAELRRKLVIVGDGACGKTCLLMYVQPFSHGVTHRAEHHANRFFIATVFSQKAHSQRSVIRPDRAIPPVALLSLIEIRRQQHLSTSPVPLSIGHTY